MVPYLEMMYVTCFPVYELKAPKVPYLEMGGSRSEEHTSELQSLVRISYAVFCLKKKKYSHYTTHTTHYSLS